MATVNVYVQDDLKERLDGSGLNLSAIAQACWKRELALAQLKTGELRVEAWEGGTDGHWIELRFEGTELVSDEDGNALYLTTKDKLVFVFEAEYDYWTVDRRKVTAADLERFFKGGGALASACEELGLKVIRRL